MRTAVTSVGPVLGSLQQAFHMSGAVSGVLTMLPVVCFAAVGAITSPLMARIGMRMLLALSLAAMTVGLATRVLTTSTLVFFALSLLALTAGAVANVVSPTLIKDQFPDRIGAMTALYTTMMAVGMAAGAGVTILAGALIPGVDPWRTGLAFWALFSVVAIVPWMVQLRRDTRTGMRGTSLWSAARSPLAWMLMLFFAFQSFQAYIAVGWFAKLMQSQGVSAGRAGAMVAVFTAVSIPVYLVAAALPARRHRPAIAVMFLCYLAAYLGLLVAPTGGAWIWMVLAGIGGGEFPLALVMIGLRTRRPAATAALSGFVQAVGYVIAAAGPLLFGALEQATGSWVVPIWLLIAATVASAVGGFAAAAPRTVDDEIAPRPRGSAIAAGAASGADGATTRPRPPSAARGSGPGGR